MKFLLFGFDIHDMSGGFNDYIGSFSTEKELLKIMKEENQFDIYQVVKFETFEKIYECNIPRSTITIKQFAELLFKNMEVV